MKHFILLLSSRFLLQTSRPFELQYFALLPAPKWPISDFLDGPLWHPSVRHHVLGEDVSCLIFEHFLQSPHSLPNLSSCSAHVARKTASGLLYPFNLVVELLWKHSMEFCLSTFRALRARMVQSVAYIIWEVWRALIFNSFLMIISATCENIWSLNRLSMEWILHQSLFVDQEVDDCLSFWRSIRSIEAPIFPQSKTAEVDRPIQDWKWASLWMEIFYCCSDGQPHREDSEETKAK